MEAERPKPPQGIRVAAGARSGLINLAARQALQIITAFYKFSLGLRKGGKGSRTFLLDLSMRFETLGDP